MGYDHDIRLENRFAPVIAGILGKQFFVRDPVLDREQGTDFAVFSVGRLRAAARLRTFGYLAKYPDEFTIRWSRPSGGLTEIDKIRQHLVDYLFYGFVDEEESHIVRYFIGDLRVFIDDEPVPLCIKPNKCGDSDLAAFGKWQLPEHFVLKEYP